MTKKEYQVQYRALHLSETSAYNKKYRAMHHEEEAAYQKKYQKKYRSEHPECMANDKKRYAEHRSEFNVNSKRRHAVSRQKCLAAYGRECSCCGESIERFLTIDHINGDGAKHRKSIGGVGIYGWLIKHDFPEGFQVLCFNCNHGRYLNGGICPHKETCGENIILAPQVTGRQSANT